MTGTDYSAHVEHPRFGRGPRTTGLYPDILDPRVQLHWNATTVGETARRYGRKILAEPSRQKVTAIAVTHWFDLDRVCRGCGRRFIFFAEEQRHWYEELGFALHADCVRCVPCRKRTLRRSSQRDPPWQLPGV